MDFSYILSDFILVTAILDVFELKLPKYSATGFYQGSKKG